MCFSLLVTRALINQPFSWESSAKPNLTGDQSAQTVYDHSHPRWTTQPDVWGWKMAPVMYICQSWTESNTKRLVLGFQVFYSVLLQTTLHSSAPLSKRSSITVSVWANPAAVRRRLTSSTTFCIHSWSSGAGYVALNHRQPRYTIWINLPVALRLSRTFITFKTYLKSHLFNLSFPSAWLYHWSFLYRALEAASAAYASLNCIVIITLHNLHWSSLKLGLARPGPAH